MAEIRHDLLEQEKFAQMIMQDHLGDNLYEGVIYALVLEDTHRLRREDIPQILQLFSLSKMPDYLFLISVEACSYVASGAPDRDIFQIKVPVERTVRRVLEQEGYEAITCTVANTDRIVALLGRKAEEGGEGVPPQRLRETAERMVRQAKEETGGEIAITISRRCVNLDAYPDAYNACRESYDNLFTDTEMAVRFAGENRTGENERKRGALDRHRTGVMNAIGAFDQEKLRRKVGDILDELLKDKMSASQIKLHMTSLISLLIDYYSDYVLDRKEIERAGISAARIILDANYVSTVRQAAFSLFWRIANDLEATYLTREIQLRRRMDQCFECMYQNPEFHVSKAAEMMGYNMSYFGKLFKKIYRTTFNRYLSEYRIERSKTLLLDTPLPVNLIAERVGFNNYTYYYTVFKAILGITPQQYRNRNSAKA